jgi:crossover junction endodeoxyribonuclease RuvC
MKIILGIDPGLASTGYGVIRCFGSRFRHIAHGIIRTSPREEIGQRLLSIRQTILEVLSSFDPDEAAVETVYFSKNSGSAIPVAQARGVILCTLAERGVPFAEYTPRELKQAVVGRGQAEKAQIQGALKMLFALEEAPAPDHAADALAAAFCHANVSAFRNRLKQLEQGHV